MSVFILMYFVAHLVLCGTIFVVIGGACRGKIVTQFCLMPILSFAALRLLTI